MTFTSFDPSPNVAGGFFFTSQSFESPLRTAQVSTPEFIRRANSRTDTAVPLSSNLIKFTLPFTFLHPAPLWRIAPFQRFIVLLCTCWSLPSPRLAAWCQLIFSISARLLFPPRRPHPPFCPRAPSTLFILEFPLSMSLLYGFFPPPLS